MHSIQFKKLLNFAVALKFNLLVNIIHRRIAGRSKSLLNLIEECLTFTAKTSRLLLWLRRDTIIRLRLLIAYHIKKSARKLFHVTLSLAHSVWVCGVAQSSTRLVSMSERNRLESFLSFLCRSSI